MTKVVIFTEIGGFHISTLIGWYLIIHKGWKVITSDEYDINANPQKVLYENDVSYYKYGFCEQFELFRSYDKDVRCDPDLVEAFEYWKPKDYKIIDIPSDVKNWYIDEADCGSETIHEEHRWWG